MLHADGREIQEKERADQKNATTDRRTGEWFEPHIKKNEWRRRQQSRSKKKTISTLLKSYAVRVILHTSLAMPLSASKAIDDPAEFERDCQWRCNVDRAAAAAAADASRAMSEYDTLRQNGSGALRAIVMLQRWHCSMKHLCVWKGPNLLACTCTHYTYIVCIYTAGAAWRWSEKKSLHGWSETKVVAWWQLCGWKANRTHEWLRFVAFFFGIFPLVISASAAVVVVILAYSAVHRHRAGCSKVAIVVSM